MNVLLRLGAAAAWSCLVAVAAHAQPVDDGVIATGSFTTVEVSGAGEVTLRQSERDQVRVAGGADARRGVEARVVGDRLLLHTTDSWKFWSRDKPRVEVHIRELRRLVVSGASDVHAAGPFRADAVTVGISGAGQVRIDDLQAGTLRFDVSGAGDGLLGGHVRELRISVSGKGKLVADRLKADRALVSISGVGHADVWAVNELKVAVSGIATVNYWGNPAVTRANSGVATIEAKGMKP